MVTDDLYAGRCTNDNGNEAVSRNSQNPHPKARLPSLVQLCLHLGCFIKH